MSNFSYCPLTWHFCGEQNTEKIQECALRFIYDDFQNSYEFLLEKSKLPSLKTHRIRTIALETFKIRNKKSPLFIQDLVIIKNNSYNFKYTNTAEVPRPRTSKYGKRSFRYEAAQVWNSLPNEARIMTSFDQFKKYINSWCGGQMDMQCMPYPTSAASLLKCLLLLFISAYICMCCFF